MNDKTTEIISELSRIAKLNGDRFKFNVEIRLNSGQLSYGFDCNESAEGHNFVCGTGKTLEDAVVEASCSIESACETWGYKK